MSNTFVFVGNLGKDPEMKTNKNDTTYCKFSVGHQVGWGERKTTWWYVVEVYGRQADWCFDRLQKGCRVEVSGSYEPYEFEGKEDIVRMDVVKAYNVMPLSELKEAGAKKEGSNGGGTKKRRRRATVKAEPVAQTAAATDADLDMPTV